MTSQSTRTKKKTKRTKSCPTSWQICSQRKPHLDLSDLISESTIFLRRLWAIARDKTRHHHRHEKNSRHAFERCNHSHIRINRHNSSVAYARQGHHTEIQQRSILRGWNRLVEGMADEAIQNPINLRVSCGYHKVADKRFGDRTPRIVRPGMKMIEDSPQDRTREHQAHKRREISPQFVAVSESLSDSCDHPDPRQGKDDTANDGSICHIADA